MIKCQECASPFTWKSVEKSLFLGYKPITCSRCQRVHDVSFITRIVLVGFTTTLPLLLLFSRVLTLRLGYGLLAAYLAWSAFILAIAPFFARYHVREDKEETRLPKEG